MRYSRREFAATSHKFSVLIWAAICLSLGWAYLNAIEQLLYLPVSFPPVSAPAPVVFQAAALPAAYAHHRGGRAALTPIDTLPESKLIPKTGAHRGEHSSAPHFVLHNLIKRIKVSPLKLLIHPVTLHKQLSHTQTENKGQLVNVKPGGNTLVLGLLLDPQGVIVRIKVLVNSRYPFMDMNYTLWLLGQKAGTPDPPIPAGHTRWVILKIPYRSRHPKVSLP